MGWCGLSLAWLRATDLFGDTALGLGLVGGLFSAVLFVLLCIACVIRLNAHPHAVAADLRHPVRHAFMATLPVSILLLANLGIHLFWGASNSVNTLLTFVWCVGSMLEIAATVWVLSRWLNSAENGGFQWATFTPVFFIPVVGNVLAPIGGVPIGLENWATAQFGVGLFFWPILQTMLFVRVAQAGPLPARMAPTWFIALVPPSLIGLSLLQLDAPIAVVWSVWGIGAFILALVLTKIPSVREHAFGMPYWAMSFPRAGRCMAGVTGHRDAGFDLVVDSRFDPANLAWFAPWPLVGGREINTPPRITTLFVTTAQKLAMQSTQRNPIRFVLISRF